MYMFASIYMYVRICNKNMSEQELKLRVDGKSMVNNQIYITKQDVAI
jgi:hypothetical protein